MKLNLKKAIFFVKSSPEAIVHLVHRHCIAPEFCGNPLT